MRLRSILRAPLLSLAALVFAPTPSEPDWTEHLYYPLLDAPTFGFYVGVNDLLGLTFDPPAKRARDLQKRIDDGEDDLDVQLQLVRALVASDEREEARELLDTLARGRVAVLRDDPEDWEAVAQLGEVSRITGTHFLEREALDAAVRLLQAARSNDEERWEASASLAQLFLWQFGRLRQAGEDENAEEALARARRGAEDAIDIAEDEFLPHGILFLVELTEASFEHQDDPEAGLERLVEIADTLEEAADDADEPEVALAVADMYVLLFTLRICQGHWNTVEAYAEFADGDSDGSVRAAYAEDMIERTQALEGHHRLWPTVSLARWWLARHAELDGSEALFDEALESSGNVALVLESAVGLETRAGDWDAAETYSEQLLEEREDERAYFLAGRLAGMRDDFEASIEAFEQALEEEPDMLEAAVGLAITLLKQGEDLERAQKLLEQALDEDEDLFHAQFALGSALMLAGKPDEARDHYDLALDLAEDTGIAEFLMAIEATLEALDDL